MEARSSVSRLTPSERIDICLRLADIYSQRRKDRQDFEWRVTLSLWSLIVLVVAFSHQYNFHLTFQTKAWVAWGVLFVTAFFWFRPMALAHRRDANKIWHYVDEAECTLQNASHQIASCTKKISASFKIAGFLFPSSWGQLFQFFATILLLGAFLYLS
jgi:hypothetical protein